MGTDDYLDNPIHSCYPPIMQTFRSKIDMGLMAFITACLALPVFLSWGDAAAMRITFITVGAVLALMVRLITATRYVVKDRTLIIHNGFGKIPIPLESIKSASPSRDLAASPALSLDRLLITYGSNKTVLVSPKNKTGFLIAIGQN